MDVHSVGVQEGVNPTEDGSASEKGACGSPSFRVGRCLRDPLLLGLGTSILYIDIVFFYLFLSM